MTRAYYNEFDPAAAAWLRELIAAGHIAPGDVDTRSIEDVSPDDLRGYTQHHFFAGVGIWSYALRLAGWADARPVWTGSCPCQPFASPGKRRGFADERHLWPAFYHLISECRPHVVFGEQVAGKDGLGWLDLVQADLEAVDYACGAVPFPAAGVGAPHIRERLYWVADDQLQQRPLTAPRGDDARGREQEPAAAAGLRGDRRPGPVNGFWADADWLGCDDGKWRPTQPGSVTMVDGSPTNVVELRGYGNGLVAPAAQAFIEAYLETERMVSGGAAALADGSLEDLLG